MALAAHAIAALVLARIPAHDPPPLPVEKSISVEMVTASKPLPARGETVERDDTVGARKPSTTVENPTEAERMPDGTIRARQLFSSAILADPRSREALAGLGQLAPGLRIEQLCNLEAMEQVHRWKPAIEPDFLVAYAMADTELFGRTLSAPGGAFRSKRHWYGIGFDCTVSADLASVAAFAFRMGAEIPESEWESHMLTADDGTLE
ncbi:DUF930 domain-containing protein [Rhizobium sp. TRM95111]|uniref:DUF930 domain-containing protein n=1 Tax=Rhizobium alarense TaxID=2846851 RepID=UPI001F340891|nr:DUF930 domain-containing protein [Rhizobium alarense]MCF3643261.1 DUF930 domain-containing protein [Rhizobium alarense]